MGIYALAGQQPQIDPSAYVAPGARLIGQVTLGPQASVWFNAVLRADNGPIIIGAGSNIQDNVTIHVDAAHERPDEKDYFVTIGADVTVGHGCIIHGCTIQDACIIGMQAVLMDGVVVGQGSIVGAGAVVLENTIIPPYSMVVGSPASVKKTYPPEVLTLIRQSAANYRNRAARFRETLVTLSS